MKGRSIYRKALSVIFTVMTEIFIIGGTAVMTPVTALADPEVYYPVYVGGVQFTSKNLTIDKTDNGNFKGKAEYDPAAKTLTLDNFENAGATYIIPAGAYPCGIYIDDENKHNLVLKGVSTITVEASDYRFGLCTGDRCDIEISAADDKASLRLEPGGCRNLSIALKTGKELIINSGTVIASGGPANSSYGIYASEPVQISGGSVIASGGEGNSSRGVYFSKDLEMTGGSLTATVSGNSQNSIGLRHCEEMTLKGGTITAAGGDSSERSCGIDGGGLYLIGGSIDAKGGKGLAANSQSYGVYETTESITGGTITERGGDIPDSGDEGRSIGVYSFNLVIEGGKTEASGGDIDKGITAGVVIYRDPGVYGSEETETKTKAVISAAGGVAENGSSYGVYVDKNDPTASVAAIVKENAVLQVSGGTQAFYRKVKSSVNGVGWTDRDGTKDFSGVIGSASNAKQYDHKRIHFPEESLKVITDKGTTDKDFYKAGDTVKIKAEAPADGKIFDKWTGGVGFADPSSKETTFIMPQLSSVTVAATYKDDEGSGSTEPEKDKPKDPKTPKDPKDSENTDDSKDVDSKDEDPVNHDDPESKKTGGDPESSEDHKENPGTAQKDIITVYDNKPMDFRVENKEGCQVLYSHAVPFWGKSKVNAEDFGGITVSFNGAEYKATKIKVNKKKHLIQILKLAGANKATNKAIKRATKGSAGLSFTVNPYYVSNSDKVRVKTKKNGSIKSLKVSINGKAYKAKKGEFRFSDDGRYIEFLGNNLGGKWLYSK